MPSTLVVQSHRSPLPYVWLEQCLRSVETWSALNNFDYQFLGDELFDCLPEELLQKIGEQRVIATDLARLSVMRSALEQYERVIWVDADFLIFAPESFVLPGHSLLTEGYAVGREVWIQRDEQRMAVNAIVKDPSRQALEHLGKQSQFFGKPRASAVKLKAKVKVHNAFLLFDRGNSFLDFYLAHALRLVRLCQGPMPPQFVGPKLLTALHNVVQCPVMESAGMLSPLVVDDLLSGGRATCALNLFKKRSIEPISGANLCSSLQAGNQARMKQLIDQLTLISTTI